MTRFTAFLAAALLSLVVGCDNSNLTNAPIDAREVPFGKSAAETQVLELQHMVRVTFNDYLIVTGRIEYTVQFDNGSGNCTVTSDIEGSTRRFDAPPRGTSWAFSGLSSDVVPVGSSFEESLMLEGYPEGGFLRMTLTAHEQEVTLDDIQFVASIRNEE